jgi:hypothetical protein
MLMRYMFNIGFLIFSLSYASADETDHVKLKKICLEHLNYNG